MPHPEQITPLLAVTGLTKRFPGVVANEQVELRLEAGQVHALLGENGAGKSTLVKIIYGILQPDAGALFWQGQEVVIADPAAARALGIAMVFQHFSLFDSLSVVENIALGMATDIPHAVLAERIVDISTRYGLALDPARHVYTLSVGERQRIEIVRCLLQEPRLLIMDEPTSVLTPQEVERLFATLHRLAAEGVCILYISHKLAEIKALCQQATILRNGRVVARVDVAQETAHSLATKMMGPAKMGRQEAVAPPAAPAGTVRLAVSGLNCPAPDAFGIALKNINLTLRAGELVGIAGVAGNGQDELLQVLSGERVVADNGAIRLNGQPCARAGINQRRALGLAAIPGERLGYGAVAAMSLAENTLLTAFQRLGLARGGVIDYQKCRAFCASVLDQFEVKASGVDARAESLSGGNLQKFIVGRELGQAPSVLLVSQPTWGVDAGAAQAIHRALRALADNGAAIMVISQDLDELLDLCDSIAAICAGAVSEFRPVAEVTIEQLGLMMAGVAADSRPDSRPNTATASGDEAPPC